MNLNRQRSLISRKSFPIAIALLLIAALLQACGANNNANEEAASGSAPDASSSPASASASAAAESPTAAAPSTLTFGFVGVKEPAGVEGWGLHKGIFLEELKKYGVEEIKVVPFQTGPDLNESVIGGRVDVGNSGDTPAILARSSGAKTRIVNFANTEVNTILVGRKDGAQTLDELKGKNVAVVKGSLMYRFLVGYLDEKGLSKDVNVININSIPDTEAALLRGEIDAYAITSTYYSAYKLLKDGSPLLGQATESPSLLSTSVVYATEDYLEKFPGFQKVWTEARQKAYEDLKANPDEYYQWLSDQTGTPIDVLKEIQPIESLPGEALAAEGIDRVKAAKDFLVAEKLAKKDFDVDEWIVK
ncbi:ABC transporter substrate-binding protein [Cohnella thailandensis]|uniref:ABC transporter substrate-binding protein n=1 Tax=Cohnella thailandensis TaxID=557557 RepID=A0A841SX99_9BACL|nr:ABC transporter substrate-binding protein [Cohnella thailandensis]MBB6634785.1 ABC transporter substrate-binding protein [Cohnella thailandensis]MBP1975994.1 NitT/TauT family transport system substrate-binding protein/sulfonate transport system substrate-binding protein [Cohnella thailandensis]